MARPFIALLAISATFVATGADLPQVDAVFADLTKQGSPGCALGVYRGGKLIYAKGYGLANIEQQVPITSASVFDIGSTSKQFTAASILLLEQQGKLSLDDDIRKYVPELRPYPEPQAGKITILQLLNHTSGIRDYLALFSLAGIPIDGVTTDETALAMLTRQKALNFAPGTDFLYSNSGYFLLSVIVKRASGKTLRDFAKENIFTPLGMTSTQFRDNHRSLIPNRALAYDPIRSGGFGLDVSYFEQTGDGAVHTSVEDLLKWDENFYSAQIGGKKFVTSIQQPGTLINGKVLDYAKGLTVGSHRGLPTVSHGGSWGGYRAELLRFPEQHFSVACLCNLASANPSARAAQVADALLASEMKSKGSSSQPTNPAPRPADTLAQIDPADLAAFVGDYASEELGVVYRLGVIDGKLAVVAILDMGGLPRSNGAGTRMLRPTGADQFTLPGLRLQFARDSRRAVTGFQADAGRTKGLGFDRRPR